MQANKADDLKIRIVKEYRGHFSVSSIFSFKSLLDIQCIIGLHFGFQLDRITIRNHLQHITEAETLSNSQDQIFVLRLPVNMPGSGFT